MALRKVVVEGDPLLNKVSREITDYNQRLFDLLDDMIETMRKEDGVGIAAPQVGILRRCCVVEVEPGEVFELINPVILEEEGDEEGQEGCLSVPGYIGTVNRPTKIKVKAFNRKGEECIYDVEDFTARAFCHEIDHLNGILYTSKAKDVHKVELQQEGEE